VLNIIEENQVDINLTGAQIAMGGQNVLVTESFAIKKQ